MAVTKLVFKNREEIGNDIETFCEETNTLVHLEIASDGLVDGLELRLDPE
jgi:hypothetical protein